MTLESGFLNRKELPLRQNYMACQELRLDLSAYHF